MLNAMWAAGAAILVALLVGAATGCARTVLETSAADAYVAADDELDFWDDLEQRLVTTNYDALHGLLMVAGDESSEGDWAAHLAAARDRGWLGPDQEPVPDEAATTGLIALAACEILDIDGGVTMRLLGPSPRYCTRELVFLGVIPPRTENQSMRGSEFVDLVGRMDARMRETSMSRPALADVQ
ncbi:MAG: hypothetical protein ACYTJ0_13910 [Planctomycetota bacterium]